jgi:proprotein convertase subtilisin/kexin type 5
MGINCPSSCSQCDGDFSSVCISCKDTSIYLYNGDCLSTCPSGTYGTSDSSGKRICKSCEPNCETCDGDGNTRCLTCASNKIKYNKNCLTISGNKKKTFISPSDSSKIQVVMNYIKNI